MQLQNLFELKSGLNQFTILSSDLGTTSGKFPILNLPSGSKIKNIYMNVIQPFKSNLVSGQTNHDSCIKHRVMIGSNEDTQDFLTWTEEAADSRGDSSNNTGSYFSAPTSKTVDSQIVFENWASMQVFTVAASNSGARHGHAAFGHGVDAGAIVGGAGTTTCEEYNGTSWSAGGSPTFEGADPYYLSASGSQTAGLHMGGRGGSTPYLKCQDYDGTSWTNSGSLNIRRAFAPAFGRYNATALAGGWTTGAYTSATEEYDGATWTATNDMNFSTVYQASGIGHSIAPGIVVGCYNGTSSIGVEVYNGNIWEIGENAIISSNAGSRGAGNLTGMVSHGDYGTQQFDGLTWRVGNRQNAERTLHRASFGTGEAAIVAAGYDYYSGGANSTQCEEFSTADLNEISLSGEMILNITVI